MTELQNCPTELILDIYFNLDNIDDALHLARCSEKLNVIFDTHRFHILKSIILRSNIHIYDVMLCHLQDALQDVSSRHLSGDHGSTPTELRPTSAHFEKCLHTTSVSDQQIWDIVARWQGVRPLQHLYINPVINLKYVESPGTTGEERPQEGEILDTLSLAKTEKEISNRVGKASTTAFSVSETGYFYRALTGYWVATESLRSAEQCCHRLQSTENMIFDEIRAIWWYRTDLQKSLEILEVFDFVYGFLVQHIDGMG